MYGNHHHVLCYVHVTYRVRVLYGWASVFPLIGSISLTTFLTITFFWVQKNLIQFYYWSPEKTFGLFLPLIECIYRHLILEVGRKSKYQRNWKIDLESNICSSPLTITNSSSQEIFKAFIVRWSWRRFIFRFPQIGRISLDNRTNIYLSDSKWESTEVPWKTAKSRLLA